MAAAATQTVNVRLTSTLSPATIGKSLDADTTLVERCLTGENAAWEELVRLHTRRVYSLCYRFTGRDHTAEELTQEVFLRVFRALPSFRSTEGSFSTWLARLTRNLLIDHYRRTRNDRVTDSLDAELPGTNEGMAAMLAAQNTHFSQSSAPRPDAALAGREASELLQSALAKLSPDLRETIILRDLQDREYREIANILSIPEGTVKSRLNRGRSELARLLNRYRVAL